MIWYITKVESGGFLNSILIYSQLGELAEFSLVNAGQDLKLKKTELILNIKFCKFNSKVA